MIWNSKFNKIFAAIILTVLAVFFLSGAALADKMYVVTTTPDLADIARQIGGDKVKVESIAQGSQDPHYVEPKPSFMIMLKNAQLYLVAGMDLEIGWSPVLEEGSRNPDIMRGGRYYVDCSRGITPIEVPTGQLDRSMGDVHPAGNPHYLLDPNNAIIVAGTIANAFSRRDPANAAYYEARRKDFSALITRKQIEWLRAMQPYRGSKVVTYHKNWSYFARRFGLVVVENVEPKPGISPSPAHIAKVINTIKSQKVKAVIRANYFEGRIPDMICQSTGAKQVVLPIMPGGVSGSDGYVKMFDVIISHLTEALK